MDFFESFDRFIHTRIMNPVFAWIQKQLHWNRFQLIECSLNLWIFGAIGSELTTIPTSLSDHRFTGIILSLIWVAWFTFVYVMLTPVFFDLRKCSDRVEDQRRSLPSEFLIKYAFQVKTYRKYFNHVLLLMLVGYLKMLFTGSESIAYCITNLLWFCGMFSEMHLWDADDIDPKDREYLFSPKTVKKNETC